MVLRRRIAHFISAKNRRERDEPTEGIQPSIIKDIARVLNEIRKLRKITIIVSEQVLHFALAVADRIAVIERGALVYEAQRCDINADKISSYLAV